jgi:hypothetical protein
MSEVYSLDELEGEIMMMEMAASFERLADTCHDRAEQLQALEVGYRKEAEELKSRAKEMLENHANSETVQT